MSDNLKTDLTVRLLAADTVVAESSDPSLWQKVLAAITSVRAENIELPTPSEDNTVTLEENTGLSGPLAKFAGELGVTEAAMTGALGPTSEAPFINLDSRYWESFRKNFPTRGKHAVPPIVLAATVLVLWANYRGFTGPPTMAQVQSLLAVINLRGNNPQRSIRNCDWLQTRSGGIVIDPAEISQAISLAKAFCLKKGPGGDTA